jgi:hypothetical protein
MPRVFAARRHSVKAQDNQAVLDTLTSGAAKLAAGTAWLWTRPEMANSLDVLFVDEAGQISFANTFAISPPPQASSYLASPALFQVQCKKPRQIELADALCR